MVGQFLIGVFFLISVSMIFLVAKEIISKLVNHNRYEGINK